MFNPDRGRRIAEIRKKINKEISKNRHEEMLEKISEIAQAKNPQGEVFKIRREKKRVESVGFPLKDKKGNIQVSKDGIDRVVVEHFDRVFKQNPIPKGSIWEKYWALVDDVFKSMEESNLKNRNQTHPDYCLPTFEEIKKLIMATDDKKAVLGSMTSEMVKIGGDGMIKMIHRLIESCCECDTIAEGMRNERLVILYKNKGELTDMDNYRGIFIRLLCLSILQKWLYKKCSPTVDENGSEFAFGGRKGRSVNEVLLIVRLIQDYCHWSKQPLILKFLDITKFFDTMNYKKCLIEAYKSGIKGKYWCLYKAINERKKCMPVTPLGECPSLEVEEVFLQGSCDAMIMAWNLMDAINKTEEDVYDPMVVINGVNVPRMLFVDDILELLKTTQDLKISVSEDETVEKKNRTEYKPTKCKLMYCGCVPDEEIMINESVLGVVSDHDYLGSVISEKGRKNDLLKRIIDCKGVINEIVEVCKTGGVGELRLQFVKTLIDSCFKMKFKHGCEVWDGFSQKDVNTINNLIPNMLKRVLEVPGSTPSNAVLHDLGFVDLEIEIEMERILLASKVVQMDENRIVKKLLVSMLGKGIPGFCTALEKAMDLIGIEDIRELQGKDEREVIKKMIVETQKKRLMERMMKSSKTDGMLMNFSFDGRTKEYLVRLSFYEARIIFMLRSRMFPTKCNFPGRWSKSNLCTFCLKKETDEHLFSCPGYRDIHLNKWTHELFMKLDSDINVLSDGAKILLAMYERLVEINEDEDVNVK